MTLGSTQPVTQMSTTDFVWGVNGALSTSRAECLVILGTSNSYNPKGLCRDWFTLLQDTSPTLTQTRFFPSFSTQFLFHNRHCTLCGLISEIIFGKKCKISRWSFRYVVELLPLSQFQILSTKQSPQNFSIYFVPKDRRVCNPHINRVNLEKVCFTLEQATKFQRGSRGTVIFFL